MFSLFGRRQKETPPRRTFKERTVATWEWFASSAAAFDTVIGEGRAPELAETVSERIDELLPGIAWNFGPAEPPHRHAFTLTAEGDPHRRLLTGACVESAPEIPGWIVHPARQPGNLHGVSISGPHGGVGFADIRVSVETDDSEQKLHVTAWHPAFPRMGRSAQAVLFLALDMALGEDAVGVRLGGIELADACPAESSSLDGLRELVATTAADRGWPPATPLGQWVMYRGAPLPRDSRRSDVLMGATRLPALIRDYLAAEGRFEDPLLDLGARYAWLQFDVSVLPKGDEAAARGVIEERMDEQLQREGHGRVLGGATGRELGYVDLLLLDGERSAAVVADVAHRAGLPSPRLEPFDWASRADARDL